MEKILFFHLPKIWVNQKLAFFKLLCIVTMSDYCLDGLQTTTNPKTIILGSKTNREMERKIKGKIKIATYGQMVIFDQVNLMPTLSPCGYSFLNQASKSFCSDLKNTWKWVTWYLLTLLIHLQMLTLKIQSQNVLSDLRSPNFGILIKPTPFCKPRVLVDAI